MKRGVGGGEEQKKDSQWKLKEWERKKGRGRGEHIHQWLWLAGAGGCWGGQTEGLIKRKISLFNLETLPGAKPARLWPTVWLVLWSGANRFIFSAQSPLSLCVGCKVDYSLEKAFVIMLLELQQLVQIILQHLQFKMLSVWHKHATSDKLSRLCSLLTHLWRIVLARNDLLHDSVYVGVYTCTVRVFVKAHRLTGWLDESYRLH